METLQRMHNRGSISTEAYEIGNSLKFEPANTEYLKKVIASGGNRKTWTISAWVKRTRARDTSHGGGHTILGVNVSGNEGCILRFNTGTTTATIDSIQIDIGAGGTLSRSHTSRKFRDTSAWYHIVLAVDTTQGTATDRFKLYVNGVLETSYYSRNNPAQNFDTANNQADNSCTQHIGAYVASNTAYGKFYGYMAEVHHVDGAALTPTAFGEFDNDSGIWVPIKASPTYGTNGFYLDFADANSLGNDANGGTDFTKTNIAASDQALDTPTNNFCTLALRVRAGTSSEVAPLREGGTYMPIDGTNQMLNYFGTIGVTKGKWYWEVYIPSRSASYGLLDYIGLHSMQVIPVGAAATGGTSQCNYVLHYGDYNATVNGSNSGQNTAAGLPSYGTNGAGKLFGVAFDATNGKITYYESGSRIGNLNIDIFDLHDDMAAGIFVHPFIQVYDNNMYINFGGLSSWASPSDYDKTDANDYGSFAYTPPSGYYALCTKNLAEFG